jgi:hypothetical protein
VIPSRWSSALEILRRREQRADEDRERLRQQCPTALLAPERGRERDHVVGFVAVARPCETASIAAPRPDGES